jgi:sugar phosphate isomerase/epimerase
MDILLHTIALEPARWTPQRVAQPLGNLLPSIAAHGFSRIEIFEPHIGNAAEWPQIIAALKDANMEAVMLSSYLSLHPNNTPNHDLDQRIDDLKRRLDAFGFRKVRIFPSADLTAEGARTLTARLRRLATAIPQTEILLETHDGSLADDPAMLVRLMENLGLDNVGLLYQPTFFDTERSLEQFELEKPFIRHLHLQGRAKDTSFVPLRDGLVPWEKIISGLERDVTATLEFVPSGICSVEQFDLEASLREARAEINYVQQISGNSRSKDTASGNAPSGR